MVIREDAISDIYRELEHPNPKSWHWKIDEKTGWFRHRVDFATRKHILSLLAALDDEDPLEAQRLRTAIRAFCASVRASPPAGFPMEALGPLELAARAPPLEEFRERVQWLRTHWFPERDEYRLTMLVTHWDITFAAYERLERHYTGGARQLFKVLSATSVRIKDEDDLRIVLDAIVDLFTVFFGQSSNNVLGGWKYQADLAQRAFGDAFITVAHLTTTPGGLQTVCAFFSDAITQLDWTHIDLFFRVSLRSVEDLLSTIDDLRRIGSLLIECSKHPFTVPLLQRHRFASEADLLKQMAAAKQYGEKLGVSVYTRKLISENDLPPIDRILARLEFNKTGSVLIPLGGTLTGYLVRIIRKPAFLAWKQAFEAGIPTEALLKDKNGNYRARERKDGLVAVVTEYAGEQIGMYIQRHPELKEELVASCNELTRRLEALGVTHGHTHYGNFTVEEKNGQRIVRVIDFDQARSGEYKVAEQDRMPS